MKPKIPIPHGAPLLTSPKGAPRLYTVLGLMLHLEPLTDADADALDEVNGLVHEWIGGELAWSMNTTFPLIDPFRPEDLDYIPGYVEALKLPPAPSDRDERNVSNVLFAATFGEFTLVTSGGEDETYASPYSYRFSSEMRQDEPGGDLHTCAMLRVTVPTAWPLGDFFERACLIAAKLRVLWGVAGLTYSAWEMAAFNEVRAAIYAHCRRFTGYDMGQYAAYLEEWHHEVRSVNWLTFIGEDFAARLAQAGRTLEDRGEVRVQQVGRSAMLRAGSQPEEGDVNRLQIPSAYAQVDEMIRPLRAGTGIDFRSPWSGATTEHWLRRFERRSC